MQFTSEKLTFDEYERYIAALPAEASFDLTVSMFDIAHRSLHKHRRSLVDRLRADIVPEESLSTTIPELVQRVDGLTALSSRLGELAAPFIVEDLIKKVNNPSRQ